MATELTMTLKEADRLVVVKRIENKDLSIADGARELDVTPRQMKRILKRYRRYGSSGLISLRKGRPSPNRKAEKFRQHVMKIVQEKYADYGPTLAAEKLKEKHELILSKETLRKWMIVDGLRKEKQRKRQKIYQRRTRRSQLGELIQIDGSYEFWFEDRGEKCCLLVCIDDATSKIMMMKFCRCETLEDYLELLRMYIKKYGRPIAFYSDKHSIFRISRKKLHEDGKWTTQFHEILKTLGIELICAHSPQAKGRVERANSTLQDRLIKELREKNICSMEEGNKILEEYTEMHNRKFSKSPASSENAHRALLPSHDIERIFMLKQERILSKDLSFSYKNELYQIESTEMHRLRGKKIKLHESKGEIKMVLHGETNLKFHKWKECVAEPVRVVDVKELEVIWSDRKQKRPCKHHPWKK
jgi:hypothetical protein